MACRTGKRRYHNERQATLVLVTLRARKVIRDDDTRQEQRVYHCDICKGWHLTAQHKEENRSGRPMP